MIRVLVIVLWLLSACAHVPDFRKIDPNAAIDGLATQLDKAATRLEDVKGVVNTACYLASEPPECAKAKDATATADAALTTARKAMDDARKVKDKFWFASDKTEQALDAIAEAVASVAALRK